MANPLKKAVKKLKGSDVHTIQPVGGPWLAKPTKTKPAKTKKAKKAGRR